MANQGWEKCELERATSCWIRKELDKLKTTDMASLLRGLEIQLGGDSDTLPHEVSWKYIYIYIYIYTHTCIDISISYTQKGLCKYAWFSKKKQAYVNMQAEVLQCIQVNGITYLMEPSKGSKFY